MNIKKRFQIVRKVAETDTGHRLLDQVNLDGTPGKCSTLHGHRYSFEMAVTGKTLDNIGVLIDFGVLKTRLGGWIDQNWDHTMILQKGDPLIRALYSQGRDKPPLLEIPTAGSMTDLIMEAQLVIPDPASSMGAKRKYGFILPYAPSAENLARFIYDLVCPRIFSDELYANLFMIDWVRVYETPNCSAEYPSPRY